MSLALPFGTSQLVFRDNGSGGYDVFLEKDGLKSRCMSLHVKQHRVAGKSFESYRADINRDYDDPRAVSGYELLHPDFEPPVKMQPDGRLFCTKCNCYVPNTANGEMRKEGAFAHSHVCGIRRPEDKYI